jgi:hypothetical protein
LFPEKRCCKKAAILYVFTANSEKPLWCGGFLKQIEYQYHPASDAVSGGCLGINSRPTDHRFKGLSSMARILSRDIKTELYPYEFY